MKGLIYPTPERIIEYNILVLSLIRVKKADRAKVLSYQKIKEVVEACEKKEGDIYDKAIVLIKGILQKHPFASGNKRTAFIATKSFLMDNHIKINVKDEPSQARVLQGIRENYYTDEEIKEWLQNGKIREFKR